MMMQGDGFMVGSRCQDCGNQAKKECVYMRCRTCCKNKGFPCQTHVKSTWIPAYRRRQRHQGHHHHLHHQLLQPHNLKRHRQAHLQAPPSGLEEENFPTEVNSTATFHCVRVSSVDYGVDEYAYQTSVSIRGHVFKGILYDQGPDHHQNSSTNEAGESSSAGVVLPHQPNFVNADALTGRSAASELPFNVNVASTSYSFPLHDASFSGMQFFPNRKS
ncbi:hypothetical protein FNV43_RR22858 [Rhamnella rubrinervis]|uniref:Uncharacterized protein n=1 Tax=Rhamnella rubrinervis TaxID=2594499 RepID=A0A8K0DW14_9ROSA|nr:hypothetical protein FNV43_RR22858 [Rhamnella rubrinervis]